MLIKFQLFRAPVESAQKCCAIPNKKQLHLFEIAIDFTRHRKIQSWPTGMNGVLLCAAVCEVWL